MARPPKQGKKAVAANVQDLMRVLNRVEQDKSLELSDKGREKLTGLLREALNIFLVGERAGQAPVRRTG